MQEMVNVYFFGKKYSVPADLTIMTAMEYAGYTLKRGCGCRHGFCGACATIYRIKAFFAAWEFETFIYVEHFAVNPVLRNGGVGSKMLKALTEDAEKMIILEVEPPTEEIAVRRVRFYERNGFFFNDYPYIQPSMGEGRKETPLFLMSTERKIDEEEYRMIRNTLYTKVYGKKDALERERFIDMC